MKPILSRVFMFLIGVPLVLILILFMPWLSFLCLNILLVALVVAGTGELLNMLSRKGLARDRRLLLVASALFPVFTYLEVAGVLPFPVSLGVLGIAAYAIFIRQIGPRSEEGFARALPEVASGLLVLVYPAIPVSFVTRITGLEHASLLLVLFVTLVFVNDTAAYVFGMLLGRGRGGVVKVSPGKTTVGFVAGVLFTLAAAILFRLFLPELFASSWIRAIGCALGVAAATILGDLVESSMKRSADVKDSGGLIPGRGGVLDSLDSIAFSAPVFYVILTTGIAA